MSDDVSCGYSFCQLSHNLLTQIAQTGSLRFQIMTRDLRSGAEADNCGDVLGGRAQPSLLSTAKHHRRQLDSVTHKQCANSLWPMQFVRRERNQIDRRNLHVDGYLAARL